MLHGRWHPCAANQSAFDAKKTIYYARDAQAAAQQKPGLS